MRIDLIDTCERCQDGKPAAIVYSDELNMVVCLDCSTRVVNTPSHFPGSLTVELIEREVYDQTHKNREA